MPTILSGPALGLLLLAACPATAQPGGGMALRPSSGSAASPGDDLRQAGSPSRGASDDGGCASDGAQGVAMDRELLRRMFALAGGAPPILRGWSTGIGNDSLWVKESAGED